MTPQEAEQAQEKASLRRANCIALERVDNWRVIDNRRMIVYGRGRDSAWQVDFFGSCDGIAFAETVAFHAPGSRMLCGDPGDAILYRERRCPIRAVRAISPAEIEILRNPAIHDDIGKMPPAPRPAEEKK